MSEDDATRYGEGRSTHFRSKRIFMMNGQYYFMTREGTEEGPFESSKMAELELKRFILLFSTGLLNASIYETAAKEVFLGNAKEDVLRILEPTQANVPARNKKPPEKYLKDKVLVEIYYFHKGREFDVLSTENEYAPYVFNDGILAGIGWTMLGGLKYHLDSSSDLDFDLDISSYLDSSSD